MLNFDTFETDTNYLIMVYIMIRPKNGYRRNAK